MTGDPTFWIIARATGVTAYVLVTLSMLAGLVLKSRPFARLRPATIVEVHKSLSLLALGATALHGAALVLDSAVSMPVAALLVPGLSPYRPVWTGVGVVAAELAALVTASFWMRRRIGFSRWRALHWATYGVFLLATLHGLTAGTDSARPWAQSMYLAAVGAVAGATTWRALTRPSRPRAPVPRAAEPAPPLKGAATR